MCCCLLPLSPYFSQLVTAMAMLSHVTLRMARVSVWTRVWLGSSAPCVMLAVATWAMLTTSATVSLLWAGVQCASSSLHILLYNYTCTCTCSQYACLVAIFTKFLTIVHGFQPETENFEFSPKKIQNHMSRRADCAKFQLHSTFLELKDHK